MRIIYELKENIVFYDGKDNDQDTSLVTQSVGETALGGIISPEADEPSEPIVNDNESLAGSELKPSLQRLERFTLYMLKQPEYTVRGHNVAKIISDDLDLTPSDWAHIRAKLKSIGALETDKPTPEAKRLILARLNVEQLLQATENYLVTMRVLDAVTAAANGKPQLIEIPAKAKQIVKTKPDAEPEPDIERDEVEEEKPPKTTAEADAELIQFTKKLSDGFSRNLNLVMREKAVIDILGHFSKWEYRVDVTDYGTTYVLTRQLPGLTMPFKNTTKQIPQGSITIQNNLLQMNLTEVTAANILEIAGIETALRNRVRPASKRPHELAEHQELAEEFNFYATDEFSEKGAGIFSDREVATIKTLVLTYSNESAAEFLGVQIQTVDTILRRAKDRIGISKDRADAGILLVMFSLALNIIKDIDHLPERDTTKLSQSDRELINSKYDLLSYRNPEPVRRDNGTNWSAIYDKLGVSGRFEAVLSCIRMDVLQLPSVTTIRNLLWA
jgi:DNA-binding CsgD family transcriptional regulator